MKLLLQFCQLLGAEIGADRAGGGGGSILREFACNVKTGRRQRGETTRRRDLGELWGHTRTESLSGPSRSPNTAVPREKLHGTLLHAIFSTPGIRGTLKAIRLA